MLLRRKGQSTAEYAILLGLVAAVAAGFLSVGLKGALRNKGKQASSYLLSAGNDQLPSATVDVPLFNQEESTTTLYGSDFKNEKVMSKSGKVESYQKQKSSTTSSSIETVDAE